MTEKVNYRNPGERNFLHEAWGMEHGAWGMEKGTVYLISGLCYKTYCFINEECDK
jgi:hypothetical protein